MNGKLRRVEQLFTRRSTGDSYSNYGRHRPKHESGGMRRHPEAPATPRAANSRRNKPTAIPVNPATNRIYVTNHISHTMIVIASFTNSTSNVAIGAGPDPSPLIPPPIRCVSLTPAATM